MTRLPSFSQNLRVLIQGANGGIGEAMARLIAQDLPQARVFATCREPSQAGGLRALAAEHGQQLEVLALDVTDEGSIASAAESIAQRCDHLDLVVNCSGLLHAPTLQPEKRLRDVERQGLLQSFEVNAAGPILVAKHFVGLFPRRDRSVFASLSARVGSIGDNQLGGWYAYRCSKAALNMLHKSLAVELARSHPGNISAVLHPGTVDTDLSQPFQGNVPDEQLFSPSRAAGQLLQVIDGLGPEDTGSFKAWDGTDIPW